MKKYFEENNLSDLNMVELGDELSDASWTLYGNMIFHDVKRDVRDDVRELYKKVDLNIAYVALYMVVVCEAILSKLDPDAVEEAFEDAASMIKANSDVCHTMTGEPDAY